MSSLLVWFDLFWVSLSMLLSAVALNMTKSFFFHHKVGGVTVLSSFVWLFIRLTRIFCA